METQESTEGRSKVSDSAMFFAKTHGKTAKPALADERHPSRQAHGACSSHATNSFGCDHWAL
jgi:hypothetical protein